MLDSIVVLCHSRMWPGVPSWWFYLKERAWRKEVKRHKENHSGHIYIILQMACPFHHLISWWSLYIHVSYSLTSVCLSLFCSILFYSLPPPPLYFFNFLHQHVFVPQSTAFLVCFIFCHTLGEWISLRLTFLLMSFKIGQCLWGWHIAVDWVFASAALALQIFQIFRYTESNDITDDYWAK